MKLLGRTLSVDLHKKLIRQAYCYSKFPNSKSWKRKLQKTNRRKEGSSL